MTPDSATVVERGPHHRVVEWTGTEADATGQSVTYTNHYTEVASGMHYRGANGEWLESVAEFLPVTGGFVAARGPHQVALASDISTPNAVTLVTPEGRTLHSAPLLLAYVDYATGESVRLADLKSATGTLVAPNVVLYADAFDTLTADVRATYTVGGFECDVILRKQLPDPALLGLNPDTTEMAVYSEWPDAQPDRAEVQEVPLGSVTLTDTALSFDSLAMPRGRAFGLDEQARAQGIDVPVRKTWLEIDGRPCLLERTSYRALQSLLGDLPGAAAPTPEQRRRWRKLGATAQLKLPAHPGKAAAWSRDAYGRLLVNQGQKDGGKKASLAAASAPALPSARRGLVLDYSVVNTITNWTFDGLITYYISGPVTLSSNVTFQAGTVIKFAATNTPGLTIHSGATLSWLGAPYRPVTLTGKDDTASGEPLPGASGTLSGSYGQPALKLDNLGVVTLTNLCIRNADIAIQAIGTSRPTVRHGQFVDCATGVKTDFNTTLQNVLFDNVQNAVWTTGVYNSSGEFLTVDNSSYANYSPGGGALGLTNSILVSILHTNGCSIGAANLIPPSSTNVTYVTAGGGTHYIENTNSSSLLAVTLLLPIPSSSDLGVELSLQTIFPPEALKASPAADLALGLFAPREAYDVYLNWIGYHHWPLDYLAGDLGLTNVTLTLTNGAVLGFTGTNGFVLGSGGRFISQGRPEALNRLGWASAVQERATGGSTAGSRRMFYLTNSPGIRPDLLLRLTKAEFAADTANRRLLIDDGGYFLGSLSLRDSQFFGAKLLLSPVATPGPTLAFGVTNNVFDTCTTSFSHYYDELLTVSLYNNLFLNGSLGLSYISNTYNPVWTVKDNFFAGTSLSGGSTYVQGGYNGYTASTAFWGGTGNQTNLVTTGTGGFQNGSLGGYYYPSSGGSNTLYALVDVGSRNATNAGLYHYTTQTNQAKETNSVADIGFHYVATTGSTSVTPLDSDADFGYYYDQIPDYLEDVNGNGVRDGNESDWRLFDTDNDSVSDGDELYYGTDPNNGNTDGDSLSDYEEIRQGVDPNDTGQSSPTLLGDWRFNTTGSLTNQQGVSPLSGGGISLTPSYEGWAVAFGTNVATNSVLRYPVTNGTSICLDLSCGTVRLTYVPDWYFTHPTNAPDQTCRLIECGRWQLNVTITTNGNLLSFQTPNASGTGTTLNLRAKLPAFSSTTNGAAWEIQLEYGPAYTRFVVNGQELANLDSVATPGILLPSTTTRGSPVRLPAGLVATNGFCLGSAADGTAGASGYLDQLTTWNASMQFTFRSYYGDYRTTPTAALNDPALSRAKTFFATTATNGLDLHWVRGWEGNPAANVGNYNLERRAAGTTSWSVVATNLFTNAWHDATVSAGAYYEYRLPRPGTDADTNRWPTLVAAWQGAAIESRGKVILLVDNSIASDIAGDLATFTDDLIGDGWTVARHDVPRHTNTYWGSDPSHLFNATNLYYATNLLNNRTIISNEWSMNTNGTNVVILLGHVTVPYSGFQPEDGHVVIHSGAWPADVWYGDVDGDWGDSLSQSSGDPYLRNQGGDYKWDRQYVNVGPNLTFELSVGRIDFDDLPAFTNNVSPPTFDIHTGEVRLLQRYLAKDHAYRRGDYTFDSSLRVFDDEKNVVKSGVFSQTHVDAAGVSARFYSQDLSQESYADGFKFITDSRSTVLCAFHGGYGQINKVEGSGPSWTSSGTFSIASEDYVADFVFGILSGSWFGDWNLPYSKDDSGVIIANDNNLLRSCLAQPSTALAVMWDLSTFNGPWTFPTQAIGDPLAPALLATLRSSGNQSVRTTFILGDPTLRFAQVKPVSSLTAAISGGNVVLSWSASGTAGAGYWVYASTNLSSPVWTRLTAGAPITSLFYTNSGATGTNRYMVRAVALQTTGSGSYMNISQGSFRTYP